MKEELRKKYLVIRKNILDRDIKNKKILDKIIKLKAVKEASVILTYVPTDDEVDTIGLIKYLLKNNRLVAVPRVDGSSMNFYYIKSLDDLNKGYMNIYEPVSGDMVKSFSKAVSITPGICYSNDGYRIGYGKGFYDRFYSKNRVYSIGLCYRECLTSEKFNDLYDVAVDEIITD